MKEELMKLVFATNVARHYSDILNDEGISERLLSYFLLRECADDFLKVYHETGTIPVSKKAKPPSKKGRLRRVNGGATNYVELPPSGVFGVADRNNRVIATGGTMSRTSSKKSAKIIAALTNAWLSPLEEDASAKQIVQAQLEARRFVAMMDAMERYSSDES